MIQIDLLISLERVSSMRCFERIISILDTLQLTRISFIKITFFFGLLGCLKTVVAFFYLDQYAQDIMKVSESTIIKLLLLVLNYTVSWEVLVTVSLACISAYWWSISNRPSMIRSSTVQHRTWMGFFAIFSLIICGIFTKVVKFLVGRPRPLIGDSIWTIEPLNWDDQFSSFPSGHATAAGVIAVVLAFSFPRWGWLLCLLLACVACSGALLGVHYPSDVAGGFTIGAVGALKASAILGYFRGCGPVKMQAPQELLWS